ncbi:MAG: type II toxin-antitoxin system RelE/ParE family toxin [Alphaproteobacteria bacterium]|nr:type II toxin-antitoxin system RelE/ParE family toxin [Alphaproteobacteria bacterium]
MKNAYILSPTAKRDMAEIGAYTVHHWGIERAEKYVLDIISAIQLVSENPGLGRSCDAVRAGYRKYPAGSHIFFYRLIDNGIDVVRVLHQNMNPVNHL